MGVCSDPSGAKFGLWQAGKRAGAALVNEPGTWNFSELNTPDPDGAKTFYGAVFGWELSELGGGSGFFRMPGYGAFLAERDPDVRKRQADVGAPEGFEDAVAWLVPATAETPADAKPPHWSVTFAVDDADAIADRAVELGGTVLVPPVDAPWVRMAVVADPQGAMFTASKFTPDVASAPAGNVGTSADRHGFRPTIRRRWLRVEERTAMIRALQQRASRTAGAWAGRQTSPRQAPVSPPRASMISLKRSRSLETWRLSKPSAVPTFSTMPSGCQSSCTVTRVSSSLSR